MTRRNFILAILALASSAQLARIYPSKLFGNKPIGDGLVMRDGWILLETDL